MLYTVEELDVMEIVSKLHKFTVPFVGASAYAAGDAHTVTCSCGWSETVAGSENVLWGAADRHSVEMRGVESAARSAEPRFPEGTPEHAAYMAELLPELEKFAAGEPPYDYAMTEHMFFIDHGMTRAAHTALINIGTNRQGATPPPATSAEALHELTKLGILGRGNGLTRKGSGKRQLLMDEVMNDAFGEV